MSPSKVYEPRVFGDEFGISAYVQCIAIETFGTVVKELQQYLIFIYLIEFVVNNGGVGGVGVVGVK